jgi:hypothetical protein
VQNRSVPEGEVARSVLVVAVLRDRLGVARDARESIGDLNFDARADDNRSEIRDALDNLKKEKEKMSKPKRTKANNSGLGARRCAIESSVEPTDGERKGQRWPGRWSQTHVAVQVVRSVRAVLRKRRDNGDARCEWQRKRSAQDRRRGGVELRPVHAKAPGARTEADNCVKPRPQGAR